MLKEVPGFRIGGADVCEVPVGAGHPLVLIAGPCVLESRERTLRICGELRSICAAADVPLVFKSSFDKANRTALESYRGPGLSAGLELLAEVRQRFEVPVTTDVHQPDQVGDAAEVVDLLQVPALLCRQTDLLVACGSANRPVNVKMGPFMAPNDMAHVVHKVTAPAGASVMVTQRGASFGYNDLVVDMRGLAQLRQLGIPACFDATHAVQQPGRGEGRSGGQREFVAPLARAAAAVGIDVLFIEVHDDPDQALSDGPCMLPLSDLADLISTVRDIDQRVRS